MMNRMKYQAAIAAGILCCTLPAFAGKTREQGSTAKAEANPISNQLRSDVAESAKNMVAAAEEMPADKYTYHPTPEQMTFGHLIVHATMANYYLCSRISGAARPDVKVSDTQGKDDLVAALKSSFDFCTTSLAKVEDTNLGETVPFFGGRTISRGGLMMEVGADYADHYAIAAMYLRLNGMLPPTAKKEK